MYRLLAAAHGGVRERRDQRTHPSYARPELLAERPNEATPNAGALAYRPTRKPRTRQQRLLLLHERRSGGAKPPTGAHPIFGAWHELRAMAPAPSPRHVPALMIYGRATEVTSASELSQAPVPLQCVSIYSNDAGCLPIQRRIEPWRSRL
jgi:hypothetical protein